MPSSAIVVPNIPAAPIPCTALAPISTPSFGATAHTTEAAVKTISPTRYTFLRPIRSAREPTPSNSDASASA